MRHRLLLLEGLPGSGKTTYAKRIADTLKRSGLSVRQFNEGELNPFDLGYCALMDAPTFKRHLEHYDEIKEAILANTMKQGDNHVIAYTKVRRPSLSDSFYKDFAAHEVSRLKSPDAIKETYLAHWRAFAATDDENTVFIYGGAFFQNHIDALLLRYDLDQNAIRRYFHDLIESLRPLDPLILYIRQENPKTTILETAAKRTAEKTGGFKDWFEMVMDEIAAMPLSAQKGYRGQEGALRYFTDEQQTELSVLADLPVAKRVITLAGDYEKTYREISDHLKKIMKDR